MIVPCCCFGGPAIAPRRCAACRSPAVDEAAGYRRVLVVGSDADLAAVLTRLLRADRLDVEVAYATSARGARRAVNGAAQRVPLIRDETGTVIVGSAVWHGVDGPTARRGGRRRHRAVRRSTRPACGSSRRLRCRDCAPPSSPVEAGRADGSPDGPPSWAPLARWSFATGFRRRVRSNGRRSIGIPKAGFGCGDRRWLLNLRTGSRSDGSNSPGRNLDAFVGAGFRRPCSM